MRFYAPGLDVQMEMLLKIAEALENAERHGETIDEPEGVRYIRLSDTLPYEIAVGLRETHLRWKASLGE